MYFMGFRGAKLKGQRTLQLRHGPIPMMKMHHRPRCPPFERTGDK